MIYVVSGSKDRVILNNSSDLLSSDKFMTFSEFRDSYIFKYGDKAVLRVMELLDVNLNIAKKMLDSIYYVDRDNYSSSKLNDLYKLKMTLLSEGLLVDNKLFKNYVKDKEFLFSNMIFNNDVNYLKNRVNGSNIIVKDKSINNVIHKFLKLDDEVEWVVSEICSLIKSGVSMDKILLGNVDSEYRNVLSKTFGLFGIPFTLNEDSSLLSNSFVKKFVDNYCSDPYELLDDSDVSGYLLKILNKYCWCSDYLLVKELVLNDIRNTKFKSKVIVNSVKEVNLESYIVNDDEYLFILGFNQGLIPTIKKDELYLSDVELSELGLMTCYEVNKLMNSSYCELIRSINHVCITYKERSLSGDFYLSNLNDSLKYDVVDEVLTDFSHSTKFNKLYLGRLLENYKKYRIFDSRINLLSSCNDGLMSSYDNKFTGVNGNDLYDLLGGKFNLSYSSMDVYYKCKFRYYLENVLRVSEFENNYAQVIGNIFHGVLEKYFRNGNFDELWNNEVSKYKDDLLVSEVVFLDKLKNELLDIIKVIEGHNSLGSLDNEMYETRVEVPFNGKFNVTFKGFIDKVKCKEVDGTNLVSIIDYKTGNIHLNLGNVLYGLDMQLPIYIYLMKHHRVLSNVKIVGIYLQCVLHPVPSSDKKTKLSEVKKKNLLLQGFSNEDESVLKEFDSTYSDSLMIKSMKVTSKGFGAYTKVLSDKQFDSLYSLVESKVVDAIDGISTGEFDINPKEMKGKNLSCDYCKFRDVCFYKQRDLVKLDEVKGLDFLGGGENA